MNSIHILLVVRLRFKGGDYLGFGGGQGQGLVAARVRVLVAARLKRRLGLGFGGGQGQAATRVRVLVVARLKRRLGFGFGDGQVRVKWRLLQGQEIVYNGVVLSCLSFSPFMILSARRTLRTSLVSYAYKAQFCHCSI